MDKRADFVVSYPHFDSSRIRETFFSKNSPPKKFSLKKIASLGIGGLLIFILLYSLSTYEFIFIPRSSLKQRLNKTDLFASENLSYVRPLSNDQQLIKKVRSWFQINVPSQEKAGLVLGFKKPQNLRQYQLLVEIKKSNQPLIMEVVVKDSKFFSNARTPLRIPLETEGIQPLLQLPIDFQASDSPNVNFSQIKEVKVFFYRQPRETSGTHPIDYWGENWVLIKNIALIKQEDI